MNREIITPEEAPARIAELRRRIQQLHPENCPYCGGYHVIRITRRGYTMPQTPCCDDMLREVLRLEREVFGNE